MIYHTVGKSCCDMFTNGCERVKNSFSLKSLTEVLNMWKGNKFNKKVIVQTYNCAVTYKLLTDQCYRVLKHIAIFQTFNHPEYLYNTNMGGIDAFIRGLSYEPSQSYDNFFTKQITRSLFTVTPPYGPGHDLLSLNIQRGRDHGLAGQFLIFIICNIINGLMSVASISNFVKINTYMVFFRARSLLHSSCRGRD